MVAADMQDGWNSDNINVVQWRWHRHIMKKMEEVDLWDNKDGK